MFNTQLMITYQPNETGLPPDANPAYTPLQELIGIKVNEMKNANLLGGIAAGANITNMNFVNSSAATEFQNYLTEVLIDLNQAVPSFEIIEHN